MSMWCPKCQNVTYNKKKCDKCNYVIEDNSKSYKVAKDKQTNNSYQDKKNKGDEYEVYIAKHYRTLGYTVIEHGKEKGRKDGGIDLIAEKDDEVILIQCKDWNENNSHKIDHKDIKVLRIDANDFLEKNSKYENYKIKLRYTLSGNFIHNSAKKYMEECKEDIDYEIIKPNYREEEFKNNYKKEKRKPRYKNKNNQKNNIEKIIVGIVAIAILFAIQKNSTKEIEKQTISNNTHKNIIVTQNIKQSPTKQKENNTIHNEKIFNEETNKFQSKLVTNMIRGATLGSVDLRTKEEKDKEECNKAYWKLQQKSSKYWWGKQKENQKIKKALNKRYIDYRTILKQRTKEVPINIQKLNEQSCSKNYFDLAYKRKKADNAIKQENDILKELARNNFIKIEKEKSLYKNNRAKEDLKKQMNF